MTMTVEASTPTKTRGVSRYWRTFAIALVAGIIVIEVLSRGTGPSPEAVARVRELQPAPPAPNSPLRHVIESVDFDAVSLDSALQSLADHGGVNIVPKWFEIEIDGEVRSHTVTLHMKRPTVRQALTALLTTIDHEGVDEDRRLNWTERDGTVIVSTVHDLRRQGPVVRVYDVRDLLQDDKRIRAALLWPEADPKVERFGMHRTIDSEAARVDELERLLTDHVRPETWRANGGDDGTITYWAGQLIVTQSEQGQDDVEAFLELLRRRD
jgi:hypothetical protein